METIHHEQIIYLIPGRENRLDEIGGIAAEMGFDVYGRELIPPFSGLSFSKQLELIKKDLSKNFWTKDSKIIGHSFGAYLILHSIAEMGDFPGRILLLSPVTGGAFSKNILMGFRPPRSGKLLELAKTKAFPGFQSMEIYLGENDSLCRPSGEELSNLLPKINFYILKNEDHELKKEIIEPIINRFLKY